MPNNHENTPVLANPENDKDKSRKISRRAIVGGALATAATGALYTKRGDVVEWYEKVQREAEEKRLAENPDGLSWQELREQDNDEIRAEAQQMLQEMGVWGEIPLVDLKDVSHLAMSGDFTLGSGEITEERVEVYNFSWTPLVEGASVQQSELPNEMFEFNIVEPSEEDPNPQASIRFTFDIDQFVEKDEHVSPEQLTGVKSYGDDPEEYINPELLEDEKKVVVTLTDEQYEALRETGVVSF